MAGYTKADFYATYSIAPRGLYTYPNGKTEMRRFVECRLHYHPEVMQEYINKHADMVLAALPDIDANSTVCIFGSGFGWLCEKLTERTGCTSFGVDLSDYVMANKDLSPDDELEESIIAAGLDKTTGMGKQIFDQFSRPGIPRTTATLRQLDLSKTSDQTTLKTDFPSITHMISEEVWQLLTDQERTKVTTFFESNYPGIKIKHIITGAIV